MLHNKPLYVAIAQRKEDRLAHLQIHYAQRLASLAGPSTAVIPGGYPPLYYTAPPGVVSQLPSRPGLMYQPLGVRPGWRANGFAPPVRPAFQPSPVPVVSFLLLAITLPNSTFCFVDYLGLLHAEVFGRPILC